MAIAWFQQPLFSLLSQLNFLLFKICDNSQSLKVGFFLLAAAVSLTDGHAPFPAITFDFTGNADPTVASFVFFIWCKVFLCLHFVYLLLSSIEQLNCF